MFSRLASFLVVVSALALVACGEPSAEISGTSVTDLQVSPAPSGKPEAQIAEVTFAKSAILGKTFLYGADLQFSSLKDDEISTGLQSLAIGHYLAYFRIVGNKLQLMNDQTPNFESDVTHPDRLLHNFTIIRQDAESVTVVVERASPTLVTILGNSKSAKERSSWIRSVEYVQDGNYLLLETTIEAADGSVSEFMESIFPRETLVPAGYKPILADANREPLAERFRFLDGGKVFLDLPEGRVETAVANRFDIKAGEPVKWYVAGNVPDQYMNDIRAGIEGWNRYFQAMYGRDGVRFQGRLPAGIKIGDPRFNVILWDNVADAGAAYESQAADPLTGIQSHSLIYLPLAWINIGKEYWQNGGFSDRTENAAKRVEKLLKNRTMLGKKLRVSCLQDAMDHLSLEARQTPEEFARELLKGVLFHEMGHALGLAHNFRGSLSFDPDAEHPVFSTSIMDYNQYNTERAAFLSVDEANGPLLEYDRQILSVLYNEGRDIKESDAVVPACNDDEADSLDGGVDPLCIRYDIGKDPTKQLQRSISLISDENARSADTVSLPKAIGSLGNEKFIKPDAITTVEAAEDLIASVAAQAKGLISFYLGVSANSLRYMAMANIRNLYIYKPDLLPEGYVEAEMRARALQGIEYVSGLEVLPEVSKNAIGAFVSKAGEWLDKTPALQALPEGKRAEVRAEILAKLRATKGYADGADGYGLLSRIRARILGVLVRVPSSPFYFEVDAADAAKKLDLEAKALEILERGASGLVGGKRRASAERAAAITALKTFADTVEGDAVIERVRAGLVKELGSVTNAMEREALRELIAALK